MNKENSSPVENRSGVGSEQQQVANASTLIDYNQMSDEELAYLMEEQDRLIVQEEAKRERITRLIENQRQLLVLRSQNEELTRELVKIKKAEKRSYGSIEDDSDIDSEASSNRGTTYQRSNRLSTNASSSSSMPTTNVVNNNQTTSSPSTTVLGNEQLFDLRQALDCIREGADPHVIDQIITQKKRLSKEQLMMVQDQSIRFIPDEIKDVGAYLRSLRMTMEMYGWPVTHMLFLAMKITSPEVNQAMKLGERQSLSWEEFSQMAQTLATPHNISKKREEFVGLHQAKSESVAQFSSRFQTLVGFQDQLSDKGIYDLKEIIGHAQGVESMIVLVKKKNGTPINIENGDTSKTSTSSTQQEDKGDKHGKMIREERLKKIMELTNKKKYTIIQLHKERKCYGFQVHVNFARTWRPSTHPRVMAPGTVLANNLIDDGKELLYIDVEMYNSRMKAVIDTGSTISLIDSRLVSRDAVARTPTKIVTLGEKKEDLEILDLPRANLKESDYMKLDNNVRRERKEVDESRHPEVERLLEKYSIIFINDYADFPPKREVEFKINLIPGKEIGKIYIPQHSQKEIDTLNRFVEKMVEKGLMEKSLATHPMPSLVVDNGDRVVHDYRTLNAITETDNHPIQFIPVLLTKMAGAKIFSKLDAKKGFYQIRIREEDKEKTAVQTPMGVYHYRVMPMGVRNAPATFCRLMDKIIQEIYDENKDEEIFVICYIDDILVFSKNEEDHKRHVSLVLKKMEEHLVYLNGSKCDLFKDEVAFVGYKINGEGITTNEEKTKPIVDLPMPENEKTKAGELQDNGWKQAVLKCKEILTSKPVMKILDGNKDFVIHTDASNYGVGSVVSQLDEDGEYHPVIFESRKMTPAERNYSTTDRELLAAIHVLQKDNSQADTENSTLKRHRKRYLKNNCTIIKNKKHIAKILDESHAGYIGGHLGITKSYMKIRSNYFWIGLHSSIVKFIGSCDICQRSNKCKAKGFLTSLEIPQRNWMDISMDFMSLPTSKNGMDNLLVVVDRLSKMVHLMACTKEIDAVGTAKLLFNNVFRLHGLPSSIVSDRDPRFTSDLWSELMTAIGTKLKMSTPNRPQGDGQTEIYNKTIRKIMEKFQETHKENWDEHLTAVEFALNSFKQSSTKLSPFEINYGFEPTTPSNIFNIHAIKDMDIKQMIDYFQKVARDNILSSQVEQARNYNKNRKESTLKEGDEILLNRNKISDALLKQVVDSKKLIQDKIGPFKIVKKIGENTFEVDLPSTSRTHRVFNADYMELYIKNDNDQFPDRTIQLDRPQAVLVDGEEEFVVEKILAKKLVGRNKKVQYFVLWKGYPIDEGSWVDHEQVEDCEALDIFEQEQAAVTKQDKTNKEKK
ncbi:hypothetical protein DFA_04237 [Cavenderia fasciculata]|uniref:Reverse transcriptase n=1 Tax=Cavenderia fasciculata TaxID=261658 RepID=F4PP06_CACFS|nr:uncharacterized protein DFA_04237 [Cavenderia fasciculata]EGG22119.1 hypothetical protein DFA_04237 [Cavenderia fasciculata]|eukprot:XP_004359970.1 hypothetical protein DFA_04237 [Cavenderia fasciculata]